MRFVRRLDFTKSDPQPPKLCAQGVDEELGKSISSRLVTDCSSGSFVDNRKRIRSSMFGTEWCVCLQGLSAPAQIDGSKERESKIG